MSFPAIDDEPFFGGLPPSLRLKRCHPVAEEVEMASPVRYQLKRNQLVGATDLRAEPSSLLFHQMIGALHDRGCQ